MVLLHMKYSHLGWNSKYSKDNFS